MSDKAILALDVGNKRIGVARANLIAKIAEPLSVIENEPGIFDHIKQLARDNNADKIVVGLPRSLSGDETNQSRLTRQFAKDLKDKTGLDVELYDEALSTHQAIAKSDKYPKDSQVDAVAAAVILDNFMEFRI